jgi:hypothetical protein
MEYVFIPKDNTETLGTPHKGGGSVTIVWKMNLTFQGNTQHVHGAEGIVEL